ncbi:putative ribonuclease H-like domain-containing protein [Tanacetum coccineum]
MAPRAVLIKTGLRPLNTARPVNTAHLKTTVYSARPMSRFSKSTQSTVKRPYQIKTTLTNKNYSQKVNTTKGSFYTARPKAVNTARPNSAVVNVVRANQVNAVKASACWVWRPTKLNSTNSNDLVGTEESIGTCHFSKETGSGQYYILMPLWKDGSLFDSSSKNANNDEPQPSSDAEKKSGVLTRRMPKTSNEQGFISAVYKGKTHEDLYTFDLPYGMRAIGTKWVYKNKKDKRGIMIRNKARLVARGYTQEEKQTIVANSTTEAEYVAAASCCGQVLWIQNQMLDYGYNFMNTKIFIDNESTICIVKNPVFHSKTKHIEIQTSVHAE